MRALPLMLLVLAASARATPPDWTSPDASAFEGSMSVVAVLTVDGDERAEAASRVAAFVDGEIRGVAGPTVVGGRTLYFLTVFGDAADAGTAVEIRAYDAATDGVYDAVVREGGYTVGVAFALNGSVGTIAAPATVAVDGATAGPGWDAPTPSAYEGYATVTGAVALDGMPLNDADLQVAAFVGGELRGLAAASAAVVGGRRLVFLSVYADSDELAAPVTFRVYVPATGVVYQAAEAVTVGSGGAFGAYGDVFAPFEWAVGDIVTVSEVLDAGEGWYGLAVPVGGASLGGFLSSVWTQGFLGADADPTNRTGQVNVRAYDETATGAASEGYGRPLDDIARAPLGRGFFMYVFADDDLATPGAQGRFPKTLTATGTPATLPFTFSVTYTPSAEGALADGWNLLGNPLTTVLPWGGTRWTRRNVGPTVYVWNARAGRYLDWNGDLGIGDLPEGEIPPFAAFWVQASGATPALSVAASAAPQPRTRAPHGLVQVRAEGLDGPVRGRQSDAYVALVGGAAAGVDALDGHALPPPAATWLDVYTRPAPGGAPLAIQTLPPDAGSWSLPLSVAVAGAQGVRVRLTWPRVELPAGWTATLVDHATGRALDLATAAELVVDGIGSASGDRFTLSLSASPTGAAGGPDADLVLDAPAPNPAAGAVRLGFALTAAGPARLSVYDVLGREVAVVADGPRGAGTHEVTLDAAPLPPGLYVVRLVAGARSLSRTLTVAR